MCQNEGRNYHITSTGIVAGMYTVAKNTRVGVALWKISFKIQHRKTFLINGDYCYYGSYLFLVYCDYNDKLKLQAKFNNNNHIALALCSIAECQQLPDHIPTIPFCSICRGIIRLLWVLVYLIITTRISTMYTRP